MYFHWLIIINYCIYIILHTKSIQIINKLKGNKKGHKIGISDNLI